ncbi:hypothetical protein A2608_02620 [Candidatus Azambacteria bacterium RIFOXYD1_FULL_44_10]|nr:MAG: hypothetical protein A2608_02620 [Candidatus Azambacteria bacterium RIFOXYD1_FULL_44_10]
MERAAIALVKAYDNSGLSEEFLIQYSESSYPDPNDLRQELEKRLRSAYSFSPHVIVGVGLQANKEIGHFFDSVLPIKRMRTFIVNVLNTA